MYIHWPTPAEPRREDYDTDEEFVRVDDDYSRYLDAQEARGERRLGR